MTALDARSRLLCAVFVSVAVAVCRAWPAIFLGLSLGLCSLALGGRDWGRLARRALLVNVFFLGIVATVPLAAPGAPLFSAWGLSFSREGLWAALSITARGNAIFLLFWGLVRPIGVPKLGAALSTLGVPERLCLILALTFRYLELMRHEWDRLFIAARLRGFVPKTSLKAWRTYALLLALLFVRALDKASAIHQAMLCRGFDGRFKSLGGLRWRAVDTFLGAVSLVAIAFLVRLESA